MPSGAACTGETAEEALGASLAELVDTLTTACALTGPPTAIDEAIAYAFGFVIPAAPSAGSAAFKRANHPALLFEAQAVLHDHGAGVCKQLKSDGIDLKVSPPTARLTSRGRQLRPRSSL